MIRTLRIAIIGSLAPVAMTAPAVAQRVDARVGGVAVQQAPTPRPYSAPINPTVNQPPLTNGVQARIGADGQMSTSGGSMPTEPLRRTREPQLMQALAPDARTASAPAIPAAAPATKAKPPVTSRGRHTKGRPRIRAHRR